MMCLSTDTGKGGARPERVKGLRGERGDVLLEYVLLTMIIILPLVGVSVGLVNVGGKRTFSPGGAVEGEDFGLLGNAFVDRYRMVMSGIALPLP
jgi:hypothetical protein